MGRERRQYPRVSADLPLEVQCGDDQVRAAVCNLSCGGLEMSCDRWSADRLLPPGHQAFPGQPIAVRLRFQLPGEGDHVAAAAEIVDSRRLAQNEYRVRIRFTGFDGDGEARLERFVRGGR